MNGSSDIDEFRLAFQQGCPKFLSPTTVVYEGLNQAKVSKVNYGP